MSSSDNKPALPAETSDQPPAGGSERAKAIARRSFLRKSAGIAAPVVMTLQSGPALAIRSITCQDKTGTVAPTNMSGFTAGTKDPDATIQNLAATDVINSNPAGIDTNPPPTGTELTRLSANDGFVRCPNTAEDRFTANGGTPPTWTFIGPDSTQFVNDGTGPSSNTGPIAYFSLDADNEDIFIGCFGDVTSPESDPDNNRPLTCSCWSSLHP